jgi:hypothetical protein
MTKWFNSKEDLLDELQSIAYQLDSACDGVSTLELLNAARDDLYMVMNHLDEEVSWDKLVEEYDLNPDEPDVGDIALAMDAVRNAAKREEEQENLDMESIIRRNSDKHDTKD